MWRRSFFRVLRPGGIFILSTASTLAVHAAAATSNKVASSFSSVSESSLDAPLTRNTVANAVEKLMGSLVQIKTPMKQNLWMLSQMGGSGFVVGKEGGKCYIVTNAHVVQDWSKVTIMRGDVEWDATVVGTDPSTDIALLMIESEPVELEPALIGSSVDARLGELVIAAGSPLGLDGSVSLGIISSKRSLKVVNDVLGGLVAEPTKRDEEESSGFLQIDCAINSGSSGGPIADLDARVLGVATLKSEGEGLAFAIPIEIAMAAIERIKRSGDMKKKKPLGITASDLAGRAVFILSVAPGSLAEEAGLKPYDIVISVNGSPLKRGIRQLQEALQSGGNVTLDVARGPKRLEATIKTKQ